MIDRQAVYDKYSGHCAYCGVEIAVKNFQVDHIHPKNKGGANSIENYNPSCRSCNATKSTYTIEEFRARLIEDVKRIRRDSSKYRILERFGILGQLKEKIEFYFEIKGKD